ncbi:MAG: hypothetical protein FJX77_06835, partial [Armatimonadetes bacterium]|nr:hypothetical protein [Armatimonadota bacterium]
MQNWKVVGTILSLVAVGVLGSAVPGQAQRPGKGNSTIGFVDLARVTEQVKKTPSWSQKLKEFEDQRQRLATEVQGLSRTRYLLPADRQLLQDLRAKPKRTPAEEQKVRELERKSDDLDREFRML